jgi:hypothetical protein
MAGEYYTHIIVTRYHTKRFVVIGILAFVFGVLLGSC